MIEVRVKLFATLRDKAPSKVKIGEAFSVIMNENSNVQDLLSQLRISEAEAKIIMINNTHIHDAHQLINAGDEISIFPPIGGG